MKHQHRQLFLLSCVKMHSNINLRSRFRLHNSNEYICKSQSVSLSSLLCACLQWLIERLKKTNQRFFHWRLTFSSSIGKTFKHFATRMIRPQFEESNNFCVWLRGDMLAMFWGSQKFSLPITGYQILVYYVEAKLMTFKSNFSNVYK